MKGDDTIDELIGVIEERLDSWDTTMPRVEQDAYAAMLELASDLETDNGRIKPTVKNIRTIARIKEQMRKLIFDEAYAKQLDKVIESYSTIQSLQNRYFAQTVGRFKVPAVLDEIRKQSVQSTLDLLGEEGVDANFINPLRDILQKNITTGGTRQEFIEQARDYIIGVDGGDGALKRYTTTVVNDALASYNAQYMTTLSDDLGMEWYIYTGTNKRTSRPFCIELVKASQPGGCYEYIHRSQFSELLDGDICGVQVPLYDKTGLPQGMKAGTNTANLVINRGGYNCGHFFRPIPTAVVPKRFRDRFPG